ncbi:hypothetical protein D7Y21_11550 [Corallococcus sp. AB045]|nr:hypothetical protein D7Y21_11550 [Corallococcus sp. AB045]
MAGGQRFQARVAAWWMTRILLGTRLGARFGLVGACVAERLAGESGDAIDDIRVELSGGARLYGQCKRSLKVGVSEDSEWGSVLLQFARQSQADAGETGERRYVLFYEEHNGTLTRLVQLLDRYRSLADGEALVAAATNAREHELAENITSILDRLAGKYSLAALGTLRQHLLRQVCVAQLRLAEGEADFLSAQDALQYGLLSESWQAPTAMALLHRCADDLLAERRFHDRSSLRKVLAEKVSLREGSDYWRDFDRLDKFSQDELAAHEQEGRSRLQLGRTFSLERPALRALLDAPEASFVVVGDAGTGKTGCLLQLARQLRKREQRVWYWAADSLMGPTPMRMGATLMLQHSWSGLFSEARATGGITLIVDGLDGVRDASAQNAYQKLLKQARGAGVRVVVSIRRVDAQYASWLKQCFAREPEWLDSEEGVPDASAVLGPRVNALLIDVLSEQELQQVLTAFPMLGRVLTHAPALRSVIRNLFSLDLLCQMLDEGQEPTALSGISTQAELFERYWERRILDHPQHAELEAGLTALVDQMVHERTLQIPPRALPTPVLDVLLSTGLIRHPPLIPGRLPEVERVEFSHHLFFDYAAERLFVRRRRKRLTAELVSDEAWPLMLRPSLVLFLRYTWVRGRLDFWDLLLELERARVSGLHRLSAYVVIAEEAKTEAELDPLMRGALGPGRDEEDWARALKGVAIGAAFVMLPRRFPQGEGAWWLRLAQQLVRASGPELLEACQLLLATADAHLESLGDEARGLMNAAAILLADERSRQDPWGEAPRPMLGWICRTFSSAPERSRDFIRELLVEEGLETRPAIALSELANHLGDIARGDARLARWLYEVAFGCWEARTLSGAEALTKQVAPWGASGEGARFQLNRDFPSFFRVSPEEATRAVLHVARRFSKRHDRGSHSQPFETLKLAGQERRMVEDGYWRWCWTSINLNTENPNELLESWRDQLVALAKGANGQEVFTRVWSVLLHENDQASLWCQVLAAMREAPEFLGRRCLELLLAPAVLVGRGTHRFARRALETVSYELAPEDLHRIEAVILGIRGEVGRGARTRLRQIKRARATLLRRIPQEHLGEQALRLSKGLGSRNADVDEDVPVPTILPIPENMKDLLANRHVDIDRPGHGPLIEVGDALRELLAFENPGAEVAEVFRVVREAEARMAAAPSSVEPVLVDVVRRYVLHALSDLAHARVVLDDLQMAEMTARFEEALDSPSDPNAKGLYAFGAEPGDAQSSAARGLIGLALRAGSLSPHAEALRRVARSPRGKVRQMLGSYLWRLLEPFPSLVFESLEEWVEEVGLRRDGTELLYRLLIDTWQLHLRGRDATRADALLKALLYKARLRREEERDTHFDLRKTAGAALGMLHCVLAPAWVEEELSRLLEGPRDGAVELQYVLWQTTRVVLPEGLPRKRPELVRRPEIVERAQALLLGVLKSCLGELRADSPEWQPPRVLTTSWGADLWRERLEECFQGVAGKFCRASMRWLRTQDPDLAARLRLVPLDEDEEKGDPLYEDLSVGGAEAPMAGFASQAEAMRAWWRRVEPILELLLERLSPFTARALVKGLSFCAHLDAPRTLHWLRRYVEGAMSRGQLSDREAADLAVELLARVFADDDGALAVRPDFRADYLRALDAYLSMGWPKAVEIALQVETLFRPASA